MSTISNILCRFFIVVLMGYASCSIGGTEVRPAGYIVKINNMRMHSDHAKSIFSYISDAEKIVNAYDNVKEESVLLSEVEKNMDITIDNDDFMATISKLYNNCLDESEGGDNTILIFENIDRKCMKISYNNMNIFLCVDKKSKEILDLSWN